MPARIGRALRSLRDAGRRLDLIAGLERTLAFVFLLDLPNADGGILIHLLEERSSRREPLFGEARPEHFAGNLGAKSFTRYLLPFS